MPDDACLETNNSTYYLNLDRKFILPLNEIQSCSEQINAKITSNMWPKSQTTYNLGVELWVSGTADGSSPFSGKKLGEKTMNLSTIAIPEPALKVQSMTKRLIKSEDLSQENSITFNYKKVNGCKVTLELQKKVGNDF